MTERAAYRIRTERLLLRPWGYGDVERLHASIERNKDHLGPWLPWAFEDRTLETTLDFVRRSRSAFDSDRDYIYGLFLADEGTLVGGSGLHRRSGEGGLEIGYWIDREHTRQGYATETTAALTRVAFEHLRLQRVELRVTPRNTASLGIPAKLGFHEEGVLRSRATQGEEWIDLVSFSITRDEYAGSAAAGYPVSATDALGRVLLED